VQEGVEEFAAAFGPVMDVLKAAGMNDHDLAELAVAQGEADRTARKN